MANLTFINNMRIGGDVQGTYGNTSIPDETITAKKLTGLTVSSGGTLSEEDSILSAISKLAANIINGGGGSGSGLPGVDGKTIRNGIGVPSSSLGVDGDFFINKSNWTIYGPKASGVWGAATSIIGPVGATGSAGPIGATGAAGAAGLNGSNGINGTNGIDGKTIRNGFGVPSSSTGVDGDFYINKSDYTIFGPKASGSWGSATSLVGPAGSGGSGGTTIASGISVTPIGNISSNNAQSAFQELQSDIDTINAALPGKADASSTNAALATKADATSTTNALAGKASTQALTDGLATKASTTDLTSGLATKADATATTNALNLKANTTDMNAALALKADTTAMNSALALKASSQALTDGLATKADATATTNSLNLKANTTDVNTALALKADTTAMNSALATKASTQALSDGLATKADATATTAALADKASNQSLTDGLALKADKTALDSLSTTVGTKANASDVSASLALKSDTTTVNSALASKASNQALSDGLALKANQSALDTLTTVVGTKANNSDVNSALALKADASDLNALSNVVSGKADASATTTALAGKASNTALTDGLALKANQTALDTLTTVVGTKASQTALDALNTTVETKANQTALDALTTTVGTKMTQPDLSGKAGKFLSNDGVDTVWLTPGLTLNRVESGAQDYTYDPTSPAPNIIEVSEMSVSRKVYLPETTTVPDGWSLDVVDLTGNCSSIKPIVIVPGSITTEYIASGNAYALSSGNASISMYNNAPRKRWMIRSSFGTGAFTIAPFIPTADLVARFDSSATSTITLSPVPDFGNMMNVSEWRCMLGSGYSFVPWSSDYKPSYPYYIDDFGRDSAGNNPTVKGVVMDGAGTSQYLMSNLPFSSMNKSNYTIVMTIRRHTHRSYEYLSDMVWDANNNKFVPVPLLGSKWSRMSVDQAHKFSAYGIPAGDTITYAVQNINGVTNYFLNGVKYGPFFAANESQVGYTDTSPLGNLKLGAQYVNWSVGAVLVYKRGLTDSEHKSISAYFATQFGAKIRTTKRINMVADGNSISQGAASTFSPYLDQAMEQLHYASDEWINLSVSGNSTSVDIARAPTEIDPYYDSSLPANRNILTFWEGSNAISNGGASYTADVAYGEIKAYCQARKAVGWKVVVGTILPRLFNGNWENHNFEPIRLQVNQWIVANAVAEGWADAVADQGGDPVMGAAPVNWAGAPEPDPNYYADGCHPNDAGHARLAPIWAAAIQTVLNS